MRRFAAFTNALAVFCAAALLILSLWLMADQMAHHPAREAMPQLTLVAVAFVAFLITWLPYAIHYGVVVADRADKGLTAR